MGLWLVEKDALNQLSGDELQTLLPGQELTFGKFPNANLVQRIECDHRWSMSGTFAPLYGKLIVRSDSYCTRSDNSTESCFKMFRNGQGQHFALRLIERPPAAEAGLVRSPIRMGRAELRRFSPCFWERLF